MAWQTVPKAVHYPRCVTDRHLRRNLDGILLRDVQKVEHHDDLLCVVGLCLYNTRH